MALGMLKGGMSTSTQAGFCAIVGRPNVGKSTLVNALVGEKISIVSKRPQTTRNRILAIRTDGPSQLVLVDTPGIHRSRSQINRFLNREAIDALCGVDLVLLVTEVTADATLEPEDEYVLKQIQAGTPLTVPSILVLNKIDRLTDKQILLPTINRWRDEKLGGKEFEEIVPVSALKRDGVELLYDQIRSRLPEGPHPYPGDILTDRAERFVAAELIREQIYRRCHQEVPYSVAIEIDRFEERPKQEDVVIDATIFVERESQKPILIGRGGSTIKSIGTSARQAIGRLLNCPVHVTLTVRVETNWTRTPSARRRFGYE